MPIHLILRFFTCEFSGPDVELVDLQTLELQVHLRSGKDLASRWPDVHKSAVQASMQPGMQCSPIPVRTGSIKDRIANGFIAERVKIFPVPKVKHARLLPDFGARMRTAPLESMFKAS